MKQDKHYLCFPISYIPLCSVSLLFFSYNYNTGSDTIKIMIVNS